MRARWAVAARLARREVRRHPWRHALVVTLILVPVLAVFATFSLLRTGVDIEQRQEAFRLSGSSGGFGPIVDTEGGGIAMIYGVGQPAPVDELPVGAVVEEHRRGADWLVLDRARADGRGPALAGVEVLEAPEGSRIGDRFVVHEGRLPAEPDEVLLTEAALDAGSWRVGDEVESARSERTFRIVGAGVVGDRIEDATMAVAGLPDDYWTARQSVTSSVVTASNDYVNLRPQRRTSVWLPEGVERSEIDRLGGASVGEPDGIDARVLPGITLGATGICALAAIVASAAFALASRQQLRSIGLLSTAGADPSVIRATLILQGALPGLAAGALAVAIGSIAAWWANGEGLAERVTEVSGARISLSPTGAVLAVVLGTFAGVVAAWQPARTASRVPVLSALAGRRPAPPLAVRIPLTGAVCWGVGAISLLVAQRANLDGDGEGILAASTPFLAIVGTLLFAFGGLGLAPMLVVLLGRAASRARGTLRLAIRGITRQRTSAAASVAAVGVALALPIGFLTAEASSDSIEASTTTGAGPIAPGTARLDPRDAAAVVTIYGDRRAAATTALEDEAAALLGPETTAVETLALADTDGSYHLVSAIDPAVAAEVLVPWAAEAIADGAIVPFGFLPAERALDQLEVDGDQITLRSVDQERTFAVRQPPTTERWTFDPMPAGLLVSTEAIGEFGRGRPVSARSLVRPGEVSADELRALDALDDDLDGDDAPTLEAIRSASSEATDTWNDDTVAWLDVMDRPGSDGSGVDPVARTLLVLAAISTLIALSVLTITLSLRSYDGRDDARAALAAGAPPSRLRSVRAVEGVAIALLGALLALPLGWAPVIAVRLGDARTTGVAETLGDRLVSPGLLAVPTLLAPALIVGVAWTVIPALAAAVRTKRRGPVDLLAPRW
jgi:hypothetical protein